MLRFLLWIVLAFIIWKIVRLSSSVSRKPKSGEEPPFANIEDAEFEDLSKTQPDSSPPKKDT